MATLTLTVNTVSSSKTIPNGDVADVVAALKQRFGMSESATNQQIIDVMALKVFREIVETTLAWRRANASVPDIPIT